MKPLVITRSKLSDRGEQGADRLQPHISIL